MLMLASREIGIRIGGCCGDLREVLGIAEMGAMGERLWMKALLALTL